MSPAPAATSEVVEAVLSAWRAAGIEHTVAEPGVSGNRIGFRLHARDARRAVSSASATLAAGGWRVRADPENAGWRVFAAKTGSDLQALQLDIRCFEGLRRLWRTGLASAVRRRAPVIALLAPDGAGKSTAIQHLRSLLAQAAPFLDLTVHQWRPGLLPALARIAGRPEAKAGAPRRKPGRFHLVRLVYYYLDFLVGSWWMDNCGDGRQRLVVYDRCAIDLYVDPYRFGLRSRCGTALLWRMLPKPRRLVLLYDEPDRILARKRELHRDEIEEQLQFSLELAGKGIINDIVRVDAGPQAIGARVLDLVFETIFDGGTASKPEAPAMDLLRWIGPVLGTGGAQPELAIVPGARRPRFLVPTAPALAPQALEIYNAQRPIARAARALLLMGLRAGAVQPFLRRITAGAALREHLQRVLDMPSAEIAVSLGTPGPNHKPVVEVMDGEGRVAAFAKIGWNPASIALVEREAQALEALPRGGIRGGWVPRVLESGSWRGLFLLVESAPECRLCSSGSELTGAHLEFLTALHRTGGAVRAPLPEASPAGLQAAGFEQAAHLVSLAAGFCRGTGPVPSGWAHGDFSPWNIRFGEGRLHVFDWETAARPRPAGWDLYYFLLATAIEIRGQRAHEIYQMLRSPQTGASVARYFLDLGIAPDVQARIFVAFLAEMLVRNHEVHGFQVNGKDLLWRKAIAGLLTLSLYRGAPR